MSTWNRPPRMLLALKKTAYSLEDMSIDISGLRSAGGGTRTLVSPNRVHLNSIA